MRGSTGSAFRKQGIAAQGREDQWRELQSDADAGYDDTIDIELATIKPNVAMPHSPDHVCKVMDVGLLKVDQVLIGSCTSSSFRDLMIVARMLKGKRVHPDVSFGVDSGSRQVLGMIAENGALNKLIDSGARILESACGFCAGYGQAPRSGGVSIRTNNRNFERRSGTKDAQVYLVSPEVAVASALTGRLTDPNELDMKHLVIPVPERFYIDDSMVIQPPAGNVEV